MRIEEYVTDLRKRKDVIITVNNEEVKISGNKQALTAELIEEIRSRKSELLEYFDAINKRRLAATIAKLDPAPHYQLSLAQRRLFFIHELDRQSLGYNQPMIVKVSGKLEPERLQIALNKLVARHEILRTSFSVVEGEAVQQVHEQVDCHIAVYDAPANDVDGVIDAFIRPFDLSKASLLRVGLIRITDTEHILMTDTHHIIADGIAQTILVKDFMAIYHELPLPELTLQYKDYAAWQRSKTYQASLAEKRKAWIDQFAGSTPILDLPLDSPRPLKKNCTGDTVEFEIDATSTRRLKQLAEQEGTSLFTTLLSVFYILLHKITNQEDIVIGTPAAGREHQDTESMLGVFINTLPLRNYPQGDSSFREFLQQTKNMTLTCFDNQAYPYEDLINELTLERDPGRNPLFDVVFAYQNYEQSELSMTDLVLSTYRHPHTGCVFDIVLTAFEIQDRVEFNFTWRKELFTKETIQRFTQYFTNIVTAITYNIEVKLSQINILPEAESHQLLYGFNQIQVDYPLDETIATLFHKQALLTPGNTAVKMGAEAITYQQLEERSRQLAIYLQQEGVIPDTLVGVCMNRSIDMIVAIMAILRAGGAYVPIDPEYPQPRIAYMIEDGIAKGNIGKPKLILVQSHLNEAIKKTIPAGVTLVTMPCNWDGPESAALNAQSLPALAGPDNLAYLIYTSGSTGRPKGVMIEHRNVVSLLKNKTTHFDFNDKDVWTLFHSHCFDFSVWEIFGALLFGGALIIVPKETARDTKLLAQLLFEEGVTVLNQTPLSFYMLQELYVLHYTSTQIRYIIFGGEALDPARLRPWHTTFPQTRLINMYGITETTVHVTYKEIQQDEINAGSSNIGIPLPTLSCYILDPFQNPVPLGVPGELYVGGHGLARGYLNQPQLTNGRFINNPFNLHRQPRLYRSGDLARWLPNGNMEYLGRIDNQVKIRGFRIELGEIEMVLNEHEHIRKSVVIAKEWAGNKQLIAYCVAAQEEEALDIEAVRAWLAKNLPDYMTPAFIIQIDQVPLTPNGKIDRAALLARDLVIKSQDEYVAPVTEIERVLTEIWMKVLSIPRIGTRDNFFRLGGDSIKGIRLVYEVNKASGANINVADLYAHQTIAELSPILSQKRRQGNEEREKAEAEIAAFQEWYTSVIGIDDTVEAVYPMSGVEKGMSFYTLLREKDDQNINNIYFHEQNIYSIAFTDFSFDVFTAAAKLLMEKHCTMRMIYDISNGAHLIKKQMEPELYYIDITHLSWQEQQDFGVRYRDAERVRATDFSGNTPLWRMTVVKTREHYHYLLFDMHHSVLDGWSLHAFLTELKNTYVFLATDPQYKPEKLQASYHDHIVSEIMEANKPESQEFWHKELANHSRLNLFPTGKEHVFVTKIYDVDIQLVKEMEATAAKLNTNFKHLCFAAYVYTISKFTYEQDFIVGIITNNRPLVPDGDKLLGCFLNAVPFRANVPYAKTWREYIQYIDRKLVEMKRYERMPFHKILAVAEEPAIHGNPLFDTTFNYIDFWIVSEMMKHGTEQEINHHTIDDMAFANDNLDVNQNTLFDFHVWATSRNFQIIMEYSTAIMEDHDIQRFYQYYMSVLQQFLHQVDQPMPAFSIIGQSEKERINNEFNHTAFTYPQEKNIIDLFEDQVRKTPGNKAICFGEETLNYQQLEEQTGKIATYLVEAAGIRKGDLVGIMLKRDLDLIPWIFGIMKAGAAYVPIDPNYPQQWISNIIEDAGLKLVVTKTPFAGKLAATGGRFLNIDTVQETINGWQVKALPPIKGEDLAYVIYTSGSTGKPKGVLIEHYSVVNRILWMQRAYPISEQDVLLQKTSIMFDVSVWELFWWAVAGASLTLLKPGGEKDPLEIMDTIDKHQVSAIHFVPSMLGAFLTELDNEAYYQKLKSLSLVFASGEALKTSHVSAFADTLHRHCGSRLINLYGPTEATVDVTHYECTFTEGDTTIPIGKPIDNTRMYIVDKNSQLVPIGVNGQLCIGGVGLAKGYLNNEALTNEKFVHLPSLGGERVYLTGDLARWLPNGDIEFLGRMDTQVKLRGFRIETGEIESWLMKYEAIKEAVVTVLGEGEEKYLAAYYVSAEPLRDDDLRAWLIEKLPDYMVPFHYIHLNEIPLTLNGKVDKKALPPPDMIDQADYEAPSGPIEEQLVAIWAEVLKLDKSSLSVKRNFFQLGGNSLMAMSMVNKINRAFDINSTLWNFFRFPSIPALGLYIQETLDAAKAAAATQEDNTVSPATAADEQDAYSILGLKVMEAMQNELDKDGKLSELFADPAIRDLAEKLMGKKKSLNPGD